MKQIWPNYSYSPSTNVLTLTGLNIDRDQLLLVTAADRGRIMYNFADSSVTASAFTSGANTALTLVATTAGLTTTAALVIYYDDQLQSTSVSISNLPATQTIAGTVTANVANAVVIGVVNAVQDGDGTTFGIDRDFPISGTVTANLGSALPAGTNRIGVVTIGAGTVTIGAGISQIGSVTASISGTVPISISSVTVGNSVTIGSLPLIAGTVTANVFVQSAFGLGEDIAAGMTEAGGIPISGTVTANSSNGSLTTRFGSVTTANTAFATSAVTNTNRKYLLIQNITTASNVITVGIGFTPTTTQGIQLFAGAGLTFEGTYIPTGAVNLLSSVTASCYTILEA